MIINVINYTFNRKPFYYGMLTINYEDSCMRK
jgi:hypothetical protein